MENDATKCAQKYRKIFDKNNDVVTNEIDPKICHFFHPFRISRKLFSLLLISNFHEFFISKIFFLSFEFLCCLLQPNRNFYQISSVFFYFFEKLFKNVINVVNLVNEKNRYISLLLTLAKRNKINMSRKSRHCFMCDGFVFFWAIKNSFAHFWR